MSAVFAVDLGKAFHGRVVCLIIVDLDEDVEMIWRRMKYANSEIFSQNRLEAVLFGVLYRM